MREGPWTRHTHPAAPVRPIKRRPRREPPPLALAPLWAFIERMHGIELRPCEFAYAVDTNQRSVFRWLKAGTLPYDAADRILCRWNTHVTDVYGDRALDRVAIGMTLLRESARHESEVA